MGPLGTMWPSREQRLGAAGGPNPGASLPFRGSVELPLGGELIEAVALVLERELLSSLGYLGATHRAE